MLTQQAKLSQHLPSLPVGLMQLWGSRNNQEVSGEPGCGRAGCGNITFQNNPGEGRKLEALWGRSKEPPTEAAAHSLSGNFSLAEELT